MKVIVYPNQIDQAIRNLRRKAHREGLIKKMRSMCFYEKPSHAKHVKINQIIYRRAKSKMYNNLQVKK